MIEIKSADIEFLESTIEKKIHSQFEALNQVRDDIRSRISAQRRFSKIYNYIRQVQIADNSQVQYKQHFEMAKALLKEDDLVAFYGSLEGMEEHHLLSDEFFISKFYNKLIEYLLRTNTGCCGITLDPFVAVDVNIDSSRFDIYFQGDDKPRIEFDVKVEGTDLFMPGEKKYTIDTPGNREIDTKITFYDTEKNQFVSQIYTTQISVLE